MTPAILFLTGASGTGKTSIVRDLRTRDPGGAAYLHFDSIGVPDPETMVREFGSGERWQAEMTRRWVSRIVSDPSGNRLVVIEGQARPSFIEAALLEHRILRSATILVHCADEEREARLRARGQPELASERMRSWAAFLHRDALARGLVVLDTTRMSVADAGAAVLAAATRLFEDARDRLA